MSVLAGCTPNYSYPIVAPLPKTPQERNFDAIWQASLETLRKYYFIINREDRRQGLIVTRPLVGEQWFEFWRRDAVTKYDVAEGSIQTIYRTATVTIRPVSQGSDRYQASVEVATVRSDRITRQVTSVFDAYAMFTMNGSIITNEGLLTDISTLDEVQLAEIRRGLVPLGADKALGAKLTDEINAKSFQRASIDK